MLYQDVIEVSPETPCNNGITPFANYSGRAGPKNYTTNLRPTNHPNDKPAFLQKFLSPRASYYNLPRLGTVCDSK